MIKSVSSVLATWSRRSGCFLFQLSAILEQDRTSVQTPRIVIQK